MNRKLRRIALSNDKHKPMIHWQGELHTIEQADALALYEYNRRNITAVIDIYTLIIAKVPDYADAYFNRGKVLRDLGKYDAALANYNKAAELKPRHPIIYNNRGNLLQVMMRYEDALKSYNIAINLNPGYADAHINRGNVLQLMKRYDEAVASYTTAVTLRPEYAEAYNNLGNSLQEMKQYEHALASYDKAISFRHNYAAAHNNRGNVLQTLKRYDEALISFQAAIAAKPDYAEAYNNLGSTLVSKGRMQEAEKMFIKALTLKPDFTMPLFSLINIRKYNNVDHGDIQYIKMMLDKPADTMSNREYLYFSLGKIYDDCGHYDEAFECYRQANEITNKIVSYNSAHITATTDQTIKTFSKDFLSKVPVHESGIPGPLFIVGMPRSGTTLMASILSNHPAIQTAGELPTIMDFSLGIPELKKNPDIARHLTTDMATSLITEYETRLRRDITGDILHVIDKQPLNFRYLGLITMLFPNAKIIHCTRDPLDTCLSNYFQRFTQFYDYCFDLKNIGHFYSEYTRLMSHWREALPQQMIEISYEDMVTNTEHIARRALDALGLEWDERCLSPHTNPCAIETASQWQVRQPIYRRSMERWRHYDKHLDTLKDMLGLTMA